MYLTKQLKVPHTEQLDALALEAGRVYSQCLVYFHRILRKKGVWVRKNDMQRYLKTIGFALHSQTVQGIIDTFYESAKSWSSLRLSDPRARLPHRRRRYFEVPYKESAIRLVDGRLHLANGGSGKDARPALVIDWPFGEKPKFLTVNHNGGYRVNAVYPAEPKSHVKTGIVASCDLGEVHPAAVCIGGGETIIVNGRIARSKRRYIEKTKGSFNKKIAATKKGSRRNRMLKAAKNKKTRRLLNQAKDAEHKQTRAIVSTLEERRVDTLVVGDVRRLRDTTDIKGPGSQKVHQAPMGRFRRMLSYKAGLSGIRVEAIGESYTSQTCPCCGERRKPRGRLFICPRCGLKAHRDAVGSYNIGKKYLSKYRAEGAGWKPVVGDMAPPASIRFEDGKCSLKKTAPPRIGRRRILQEAS